MKVVYAMFLSSVCALAIDCTTINIEAEKARLQNEMDVTSSLGSQIRTKQREESKAFQKCLLFQDLQQVGGFKRAKALQSLSKLKNLTKDEKSFYKGELSNDIERYRGYDFGSIGHKSVQHIFYSIEEKKDNINIIEFFMKNNKIESAMQQMAMSSFATAICTKEPLTKEYLENALEKEFPCEIPANQE